MKAPDYVPMATKASVAKLESQMDTIKGKLDLLLRVITEKNLRIMMENSLSPTQPQVSKTSKKKKELNPEHLKFATDMLRHIKRVNTVTGDTNLNAWANQVRLLVDRDGRNIKQAWETFIWANFDDFWRTNIRSPKKLDKHYDKLRDQMRIETSTKSPLKAESLDYYRDRKW